MHACLKDMEQICACRLFRNVPVHSCMNLDGCSEKQGSYLPRPNSVAGATVIPCDMKLPLIWHADRPPFHRARPVTEMGRQFMFIVCVSTPKCARPH